MGNTPDNLGWHAFARVAKYTPEQTAEMRDFLGREPVAADWEAYRVDPDRVTEADGNLITTAGLQRITNLIIGTGAAAFTATQAVIGVGDSATAATASDAALGANGSNAWYQIADSAPTAVAGVITAVTTYDSTHGNFAWNEWGWAVCTGTVTAGATLASVGATANQLINHKIASLGTKASGASWVFTTTVTLSSS
ncbi:hypothetical protein [Streptomyces sp. NPDC002666]